MEVDILNILIAEDNQDLRQLLELHLIKEAFTVYDAENGLKALEIFKNNEINLAILDVMMPGLDGFNLLRKIRETSEIPVIFLTARGEDSDKILGLGLGADDYMVKPFNPIELIARVHAQLRRSYKYKMALKIPDKLIIQIGDLTFDKNSYSVYKDNKQLECNAKELKLLQIFMENVGRVYTKKQLYEVVWEDAYFCDGDDNTIMVHISHLRDKIEDNPKYPQYLKTIRGIGYKLENNLGLRNKV
ncbi:response regulator transcription factor [Clostridium sp. CM027]|uniref:response regulator transcription factor n=1 Tax=Clostridium sp. CM027 TaxID=2849865 RepID=UPI001C6E895E|nr:response regulator transcription factor [Clostridium sp. CM027]MBW9146473.1 response regulator transcription factor [Clostridium sp. CM027]UVE41973.1 response regulator transcription factor [Clostridium sp. CM027]